MDADDRIKSVHEQGAFGPEDPQRPLCPACGKNVFVMHQTDDDWMPQLCSDCVMRRLIKERIRIVTEPEAPRPRRCNRCCEVKPSLYGAWCIECRDKAQWKVIYAIIETPERDRTDEQTEFISRVAPHYACWPVHRAELEAAGVWIDPPAPPHHGETAA